MPKPKKRPSKNAKAAQKLLNDSQLLADHKAAQSAAAGQEFKLNKPSPKTSTAIKPRPDKKRG